MMITITFRTFENWNTGTRTWRGEERMAALNDIMFNYNDDIQFSHIEPNNRYDLATAVVLSLLS